MKKTVYLFLFLFILFLNNAQSQPAVETYESLTDRQLTVEGVKDVHLTGADRVLVNSTVDLASEEAWLFFDNIKPYTVIQQYKNAIHINGQPLVVDENARVNVYAHGTVVIPHTPAFQPLEAFTEKNYGGESARYGLHSYHNSLGEMNDRIRSFKLKRGYMATVATRSNGLDYSRVYIADREDLLVPELPAELDRSISFIRVFRWEWPSKKGWAGDENLGNMVDATWFYTWGAERDTVTTYYYEFVPERHNLGWPSWTTIGSVENVTHLLGLNEPDHAEQSNASVEQAIADWPNMLKTGLRLGSPATTDFNWLYRFMKQCQEKNYRVDFVVVHCYWANKSPKSWYNDLKYVHERTGRPIWIKEWNNGANWTGEKWPSDMNECFQKQLNDLKGILEVMDTASFIERYSIYNWVEDKRAMILNNELTPAGKYYKENRPALAFNRANEVIPVWTPTAPTLEIPEILSDRSGVSISWSDYNGGLTRSFVIERSNGASGEFTEIARIEGNAVNSYVDPEGLSKPGQVSYRVVSVMDNGKELRSNETYFYVTGGDETYQYGNCALQNTEWTSFSFQHLYPEVPVVITGVPSYNNSNTLPLTSRVNSVTNSAFSFHLEAWKYLENPALRSAEKVAYLSLPKGSYNWGEIKAQAGVVENVIGNWKQVQFDEPFDAVPVVFVTQNTSRTQIPSTVRVRNVTNTGFEVRLMKEEGISNAFGREGIAYLAATPGTGMLGDKKISVGLTPENSVGTFYYGYTITFPDTYENPAFFATMQTANDDYTTTLRYNVLRNTQAKIFKTKELSANTDISGVAKETVGWMVFEGGNDGTGLLTPVAGRADYSVYPNPVSEVLFIHGAEPGTAVRVFDTTGVLIMQTVVKESGLDVSALKPGCYFLKVDTGAGFTFLKN